MTQYLGPAYALLVDGCEMGRWRWLVKATPKMITNTLTKFAEANGLESINGLHIVHVKTRTSKQSLPLSLVDTLDDIGEDYAQC